MDTAFASPAERRRLEYLAARIHAPRWIVSLADPRAEVALAAAASTPAPVAALVGPDPGPAMARLARSGMRQRVQLIAGDVLGMAAAWHRPVALLCLPARDGRLPALLAAWDRHIEPGGSVLLLGGSGPAPADLGLAGQRWIAHVAPGRGTFLLTRRPHG